MASRRFFGYDPYDYYFPYYHRQQQPAAAHNVGRFFPAAAEPAAAEPARRRPAPSAEKVTPAPRARSTVSIPVHFVGSDPELAAPENKRALSAEGAAVRVQATARGFLARRAVHALRAVEREAEEVAAKVTREAEALRGDARARVVVGEALMRLLLRLDAVRGVREYRRRVAKRVLALQDAVDALEPRPAPVGDAAEEPEPEATAGTEEGVAAAEDEELLDATEPRGETEASAPPAEDGTVFSDDGVAADVVNALEAGPAPVVAAAEEPAPEAAQGAVAEEGVAAAEKLLDATEDGNETEASAPAEAGAEMEVDRDIRAANEQPCSAARETEQTVDGANQSCNNTSDDGAAVEDEREMVTEEPGSAELQRRQEPAGEASRNEPTKEAGGLDEKRVMEMVAALCERSAQQCTVIGALAERVDALERAVRRVEDAERRRRRAKKLKTEGRGSNRNKCHVD